MNRINRLFRKTSGNVLSIYFTAGFPDLDSTTSIIRTLAEAGADMIEVGIPFSDPMADGPVIQRSSDAALKNGMNLDRLFHQMKKVRNDVELPLLLMGYLNPVMQYGLERFCEDCATTGIDGLILPDLPLEVFTGDVRLLSNSPEGHRSDGRAEGGALNSDQPGSIQELFSRHDLHNIFLISPQTGMERIRMIDRISGGFIYMVSASSTTGVRGQFTGEQKAYFRRIREMGLANPRLIGFGISDRDSFMAACEYADGAIIGSAFVRMLSERKDLEQGIKRFVEGIRN
jgi:tryptophan synthase alpha chain